MDGEMITLNEHHTILNAAMAEAIKSNDEAWELYEEMKAQRDLYKKSYEANRNEIPEMSCEVEYWRNCYINKRSEHESRGTEGEVKGCGKKCECDKQSNAQTPQGTHKSPDGGNGDNMEIRGSNAIFESLDSVSKEILKENNMCNLHEISNMTREQLEVIALKFNSIVADRDACYELAREQRAFINQLKEDWQQSQEMQKSA